MTDFVWKKDGVSFLKDIESKSLNSLKTIFQRYAPYHSLTFLLFSFFLRILGLVGGATWLGTFP